MRRATLFFLVCVLIQTIRAELPTDQLRTIDGKRCGIDQGCLLSPPGCDPTQNCDRSLAYSMHDQESILFELNANVTGADFYVAIGFSEGKMEHAAIAACTYDHVSNTANVSLWHTLNGHSHPFLVNQEEDPTAVTVLGAGIKDGTLICRFTQKIHSNLNTSLIYSLDEKHFLLLAKGKYNTTTQQLGFHFERPVTSPMAVNVTWPYYTVDTSSCSRSKGCVLSDDECKTDKCRILTYSADNEGITFELQARLPNVEAQAGYYVAVGFSDDDRMGEDLVTVCTYEYGQANVSLWYNPQGHRRTVPAIRTDAKTDPIFLSGGLVDDLFVCRFKQRFFPSQSADSANPIELIKQRYYIFVASGLYKNESLAHHSSRPVISRHPIDLADNTGEAIPPLDADVCKSKGCLLLPANCDPNVNCDFALTFVTDENKNWVSFELLTKQLPVDTQYAAVGFSLSGGMPQSAVTACLYSANSSFASVGLFYNGDHDSEPVELSEPISNVVQLIEIGAINGYLVCRFRQKVVPSNQTLHTGKVFTLNEPYVLLLARGAYDKASGQLQQHGSNDRFYSSDKVSLDHTGTVKLADDSNKKILIKTHGILMLLGWWFCIINGILVARYFKSFAARFELFGQKLWFMMHRTVNISGMVLVIIAFICIFVAKEGVWIGKANNPARAHAILGMTAFIGGLLNPIMAVFRCHPGTSNRPIFNWGHRTVGTIAWVCASAAVFQTTGSSFKVGLEIDGSRGHAAQNLMIAFCVILGLVILVLEEVLLTSKREVAVATQVLNGPAKINKLTGEIIRFAALVVLIGTTLIVVITLAAFIGSSS